MNALALFGWTFILVFAFGFINRGGYLQAFFLTFAIGVAYLVVFRLLPMVHTMEMWAYLLGGPFGIVASMAIQRRREGPRETANDVIYDGRAPWRRR
jgi:hypothetical protein